MCGIAGIYAYCAHAPHIDRDELLRIRDHMTRRGPDGAGLWVSNEHRIGLAHRRLAIIDVSEAGTQPMLSADGRYVVTFNGEIYNYRELRREFEAQGVAFQSHSDTEILLHLYAKCGERMVDVLRGMFAFAIWDKLEHSLFLARDPFGIKPLYYADDGKTFRFASQVKALRAGGAISDAPEPAGSVGFLLLGAVPEPYTLYRDVRSLPAGTTLKVGSSGRAALGTYFNVRDVLLAAQDSPPMHSSEVQVVLAEAARDSVRAHLVADVPVGVFLSAGIDSGTITALAIETGIADLNTLTLGFEAFRGTSNDEVPLARKIAQRYGTRHETHWVGRIDFDQEQAALLDAMDQPSIDGVNTYLLSRAAARVGMKVALSGLGGDELFGGYPSFAQVPRSVRALGWARHAPWVGSGMRALVAPWIGRWTSPKYAGLLEYGSTVAGAYLLRRGLFMPWELDSLLDPAMVRAGLDKLDVLRSLAATAQGLTRSHAQVATLELVWYMRNQLLRDADWAGMAHSLEIRVPLVDVSLFKALAVALCGATAPGKAAFARTPHMPLPNDVVERAKSGFATPVSDWISDVPSANDRGLRSWAKRLRPKQPKLFRVLALVTDAYGGHGGIAKFNRDAIGAIAAMPNCAQVVVLPRVISRPIEDQPAGVRFIIAAARGKLAYVVEIIRALRAGPFDIVLIGHINLTAIGVAVARRLRAKSHLTLYGIEAWRHHRSRVVRAALAQVDSIASISRVTTERFCAWSGLPGQRLQRLPCAVDLSLFTPGPKPRDLLEAYGLEGSTVLMTFGRLAAEERYKGFDEVLEAMPQLVRDIPMVKYMVCGDGPDRDRLVAKTQDLGVADHVVFTGFVPEERKADFYRLADAYVMPSRGEGFGIVYLEAAACGVPVMGSRIDGSRDALLDGKLGELVDPRDADDVRTGIVRTLARPRCVPQALSEFALERFNERVATMVDQNLSCGALRESPALSSQPTRPGTAEARKEAH